MKGKTKNSKKKRKKRTRWKKCSNPDCDRTTPHPMDYCSSECYRKMKGLTERLEVFKAKQECKKNDDKNSKQPLQTDKS